MSSIAATATAVTTTMMTAAHSRLMARLREVSVAGARLRALAVALVQAALDGERLARLGDVVGERGGQRVTQRQLDQCAHDRDVLGVRRQRVGGDHPSAL